MWIKKKQVANACECLQFLIKNNFYCRKCQKVLKNAKQSNAMCLQSPIYFKTAQLK